MLLLGASIIKLPNWRAVALGTNVSVCAARMVAMPLLALGMWIMLARTFGREWRLLDQSWPGHIPALLVALCTSAMPTGSITFCSFRTKWPVCRSRPCSCAGNTMIMLVELGGGDRATLTTLIFLQAAVAPLVLGVSLSGFVMVVASGTL